MVLAGCRLCAGITGVGAGVGGRSHIGPRRSGGTGGLPGLATLTHRLGLCRLSRSRSLQRRGGAGVVRLDGLLRRFHGLGHLGRPGCLRGRQVFQPLRQLGLLVCVERGQRAGRFRQPAGSIARRLTGRGPVTRLLGSGQRAGGQRGVQPGRRGQRRVEVCSGVGLQLGFGVGQRLGGSCSIEAVKVLGQGIQLVGCRSIVAQLVGCGLQVVLGALHRSRLPSALLPGRILRIVEECQPGRTQHGQPGDAEVPPHLVSGTDEARRHRALQLGRPGHPRGPLGNPLAELR